MIKSILYDIYNQISSIEFKFKKYGTKFYISSKTEESVKNDIVEIKKDNMIVIDDATGETIPPITHEKIEVHLAPGLHEEHHVPVEEVPKKLEPKYDYDAPFSFKEKKGVDGGDF